MDVEVVTFFCALLTLIGLGFLAVVGVGSLVRWRSGSVPRALMAPRLAVGDAAVWLACGVALTCMLGSLYMSEVAKFPPCNMCWYQRICMYPNVLLLAIAAWRRDRGIRFYSIPLVSIGFCISVLHYLHERFPGAVPSSCTTTVPCSVTWVWELHFISIPFMAGTGFALIATLLALSTDNPNQSTNPAAASVSPIESPEEIRS